jgi:SanA protein
MENELSENIILNKKNKKRLLFHGAWTSIAIVLGLIVLIAFSNVSTYYSSIEYVYKNADKIPYNEYGLVLGTSKTVRGIENFYFTDRMNAAALLYHKGKIKYILASGAVRKNPNYDEPSDIIKALVARKVPADRIIRDDCGYRTLGSIYRAHDAFGLKKFTVISQYSHITRAIYIARNRKLDVIGFAADNGRTQYFTLYDRMREYLSKVKMMLDLYILNTKAKVPIKKSIYPEGTQ